VVFYASAATAARQFDAASLLGTTPRSRAVPSLWLSLRLSLRLCLRLSPASGTLTSHALLAQTSLERTTSVGCRHPHRICVLFTRIFGRCLCHSDPTNSQAILQVDHAGRRRQYGFDLCVPLCVRARQAEACLRLLVSMSCVATPPPVAQRSIVMTVSVCVCLSASEHISRTTRPIFTECIVCACCYLRPWLGHPLAALRYVV